MSPQDLCAMKVATAGKAVAQLVLRRKRAMAAEKADETPAGVMQVPNSERYSLAICSRSLEKKAR